MSPAFDPSGPKQRAPGSERATGAVGGHAPIPAAGVRAAPPRRARVPAVLAALLAVCAARSAADATPFGLALGRTRLAELTAALPARHAPVPLGTNPLSGGPTVALDPAALGLADATRATLVFDPAGILQAVLLAWPRDRFDALLARLEAKYTPVERHLPPDPGADRYARFEDGATRIVLTHPWLRMDLELNYIQRPLYEAAARAQAAAAERRMAMGEGGL